MKYVLKKDQVCRRHSWMTRDLRSRMAPVTRVHLAPWVIFFCLCPLTVAQCPPPKHGQTETFAAVKDIQAVGGPAGIEITFSESPTQLLATLREFQGSAKPAETKLSGMLEGCDVKLSGRSALGPVDITGHLSVAAFQGTIRREIRKRWYSEQIFLKRKVPDPERQVVGFTDARHCTSYAHARNESTA